MTAYRKTIPLDKSRSILVSDDFEKQVEKSSRTDRVCPMCGTMVRALVHKPCQTMDICGPTVRVWCPKCGERTAFTMFGDDREKALEIWIRIMNNRDAFRWYVEKVADERRQAILKKLSKIEPTFTPLVENPDYTQLLKLKNMKDDIMTELRKFAEESFTINSYDAVPITMGNGSEEEEEVDERTEWAISDVKKGVFDSRDYGVRGTYYSDIVMTAEEGGLHISVSHDEYCFKFNKRFMIEDMITVLQKCLEKMDKEVKK